MHEKALQPAAADAETIRRPRWRRWAVVPWGTFLLEMASIVASVLLALWVSDWNEHRKDVARADEAIAGIRRELHDNRIRLGTSSEYYSQLVATMDSLRSSPSPEAPERFTQLPGWRGLQPPLITDDVFSAALSTQVLGPIDFNLVATLSQTYGALRQCRALHDRFLTDIYEGRVSDLTSFRGRLRDLVSMSDGVGRTVSAAVAVLDARAHPDGAPTAQP